MSSIKFICNSCRNLCLIYTISEFEWNCFNLRFDLLDPPMKNWSEIRSFSLFERQNAANLNERGLQCFRGTWYQSWTTHDFTIQQELVERCLESFSFVFILQMIQCIFVDLLSKSEFCWCKNSHFPKFQKFLVLELLFQMVSYQRKNVHFWWLTRRWIAHILNFLTHCSTLSHLCFSLIWVLFSPWTLYARSKTWIMQL